MGNKEVVRFNISSFLLLIAVIVICIMGCLLFVLYGDKNESTKKIAELDARIQRIEKDYYEDYEYDDEDEYFDDEDEYYDDEEEDSEYLDDLEDDEGYIENDDDDE